jgi:ribonuclease D
VVHDGRGDLGVLYHRYGWAVEGFFDTQLAYVIAHGANPRQRLAGLNEVLGAFAWPNAGGAQTTIVNPEKGAMEKALARDRWYAHRRPPTAAMVAYSAAGVRPLVFVHDCLVGMMNEGQLAQTLALSAGRAQEAHRSIK